MHFALTVSGQSFHLTNIYGPADPINKLAFISWLYNFDTTNMEDSILMGDLNLMRSTQNRTMPSGNHTDMLLFNDIIQHLELVEIPFKGRAHT